MDPAVRASSEPTTAYCPRCGRPMRVAAEHLYLAVGCPHCSARLEPWRLVAAAHEAATVPYPPPPGVNQVPQPPPGNAAASPYPYSWRNRWVAGILGVVLGTFGVHRFYLGYTGVGLIMILVGVFTLFTVSAVWGFIEGILCFCGAMRDVDGRPLSG